MRSQPLGADNEHSLNLVMCEILSSHSLRAQVSALSLSGKPGMQLTSSTWHSLSCKVSIKVTKSLEMRKARTVASQNQEKIDKPLSIHV